MLDKLGSLGKLETKLKTRKSLLLAVFTFIWAVVEELLTHFTPRLIIHFCLLSSVALSLEAKLQMLHSYMTVTWLPLPCEVLVTFHIKALEISYSLFQIQILSLVELRNYAVP